MRASAICRSDMSIYVGNSLLPPAPGQGLVIPGHEPAGDVVEVGSAARGVAVETGSGVPRGRLRRLPLLPERRSHALSNLPDTRLRPGRR